MKPIRFSIKLTFLGWLWTDLSAVLALKSVYYWRRIKWAGTDPSSPAADGRVTVGGSKVSYLDNVRINSLRILKTVLCSRGTLSLSLSPPVRIPRASRQRSSALFPAEIYPSSIPGRGLFQLYSSLSEACMKLNSVFHIRLFCNCRCFPWYHNGHITNYRCFPLSLFPMICRPQHIAIRFSVENRREHG